MERFYRSLMRGFEFLGRETTGSEGTEITMCVQSLAPIGDRHEPAANEALASYPFGGSFWILLHEVRGLGPADAPPELGPLTDSPDPFSLLYIANPLSS